MTHVINLTLGLRKRRLIRRTDDGYEEVLAEVTPAGSARGRDEFEQLMSEEMQPSLEKTKRALVARRGGRGRPRRVGGDSENGRVEIETIHYS